MVDHYWPKYKAEDFGEALEWYAKQDVTLGDKSKYIISVIKMSECYDVSLDYLLKGEQKMKGYERKAYFDTKIFRLTESLKALDYLNLTEVFYGFIY